MSLEGQEKAEQVQVCGESRESPVPRSRAEPRTRADPRGRAEPRSGLEFRGGQRVRVNTKQFDSCLAETRDTGLGLGAAEVEMSRGTVWLKTGLNRNSGLLKL